MNTENIVRILEAVATMPERAYTPVITTRDPDRHMVTISYQVDGITGNLCVTDEIIEDADPDVLIPKILEAVRLGIEALGGTVYAA